jgi:hypothetical protein
MTSPDVTTGEMPSSMVVPREDAKMTRTQYIGSDPCDVRMPYSGSREQIK